MYYRNNTENNCKTSNYRDLLSTDLSTFSRIWLKCDNIIHLNCDQTQIRNSVTHLAYSVFSSQSYMHPKYE